MSAYKDEKTKTWYVSFYYKEFTGKNKKKTKRGFTTKKAALEWERSFLQKNEGSIEMSFGDFLDVYIEYMKPRVKHSTQITKISMIEKWIRPFFKDLELVEITPRDISKWQTEMMMKVDPGKGTPYSPVYLRTLNNQLSTVFNHAVRFYDLPSNPTLRAGGMGRKKGKPVEFWTQEEFLKFLDPMRDKEISYYAFEILYWCGIRSGELLALTANDINLKKKTLSISKTFYKYKGQDYITSPKTEKSNRVITMPDFLCEELKEYLTGLSRASAPPNSRLFPVTKGYLQCEMLRGCKEAGVKRIKIHAFRHSAISLLIDLGYSPVAIAERMGHESIDITLNYAHLFPTQQANMAQSLNDIRDHLEEEE